MTRSNVHRLLATAAAALLTTAALASPANQAKQAKTFEETTNVVAVEIPVQVVADGHPVRGLTAANFEVYDGRKVQDLTGFDVVDLGAPSASPETTPVPQVPAVARRHFLLLFDLSFSEPSSIVKAREAARQLVLKDLHPSDLVGVAVYSLSQGPRLVLGFTSDRKQVDLALDTLGLPQLGERNPDPLNLVVDAAVEGDQAPNSQSTREQQSFKQDITAQLRDISIYQNRLTRDVEKNKVDSFSRALSDLGKLLASVPGQKEVVYLSEGFDASTLLGTTDQKRIQEMNLAAMRGDYSKVDSEERFGSSKSVSAVDDMIEAFRRAGCVIQAVDIGGLRTGADVGQVKSTGGQDSLFIMADGTGGELYRNFNNLGEAMGKLLERTSVTYVLTFQPSKIKMDGSFHKIRIKLKDVPGNPRVLHRPGYYAPKPPAERSALERQLSTAELILGGGQRSGSIRTDVLAGPFGLKPGKTTYVPVLVEIDGESLLAGHKGGGRVPTEIYVYALDREGGVRGFFSQQMTLDLDKVGAALRKSGLKLFGDLDLPPGSYEIRVLVRSLDTWREGLDTVSVEVPAPGAATPLLLPPLFPEQPGKWLIVRGPQKQGQAQPPYPFMLRDQPFIPSVRPRFHPGDRARLVLTGFHLAPGSKLEGHVLGLDGQPVGGGKLALEGPAPTAQGRPAGLTATFNTAGLTPGDYTLRVALVDPASGAREESSLPLSIVK